MEEASTFIKWPRVKNYRIGIQGLFLKKMSLGSTELYHWCINLEIGVHILLYFSGWMVIINSNQLYRGMGGHGWFVAMSAFYRAVTSSWPISNYQHEVIWTCQPKSPSGLLGANGSWFQDTTVLFVCRQINIKREDNSLDQDQILDPRFEPRLSWLQNPCSLPKTHL